MANTRVFGSVRGQRTLPTNTKNLAGGRAYQLSPEQALAQLAVTGCFGDTFYASAESQLAETLEIASKCSEEYVAKTALYARERGFMKDMPAVLLAHLASRGAPGVRLVGVLFPHVIDNGKMLRNFVQVIRSGVTGRKSFGTALKRYIRTWLAARPAEQLFRDSVGNDPSIADVLKMVHPSPRDAAQQALFGYLIGAKADGENGRKGYKPDWLPQLVKDFEAFKRDRTRELPDVPFQMLDSTGGLDKAGWTAVAQKGRWQMTRMNLANFQKAGVFEDPAMVKLVADRLADAANVHGARAFPYQLLMAYKHVGATVPGAIAEALQTAMEHAIANVPALEGRVVLCPDVSGSMSSPITGARGHMSAVRCVDVAGLVTAALLRRNTLARVIPFETDVVRLHINPRDSVMTIADQIAAVGGGGTTVSAPLALLNKEKADVDMVVIVSDDQSWVETAREVRSAHERTMYEQMYGRGTVVMEEWNALKVRCPKAKLVTLDLTPNTAAQSTPREDILRVGGFSDQVFDILALFADAKSGKDHWVDVIQGIALP